MNVFNDPWDEWLLEEPTSLKNGDLIIVEQGMMVLLRAELHREGSPQLVEGQDTKLILKQRPAVAFFVRKLKAETKGAFNFIEDYFRIASRQLSFPLSILKPDLPVQATRARVQMIKPEFDLPPTAQYGFQILCLDR